MKEQQKEIFKRLVTAYYKGTFEMALEKIMKEEFEDQEEARAVILNLCGVELDKGDNDYDFIYEVVEAITQSRVRESILQKVHKCTSDCEHQGDKSKCQSVCPFDAIVKDPFSKDKTIDDALCMKCGRCITACDKGHYLETKQFLPLASLIREHQKVVAIVAPAIAGQFGKAVTLDQLREAFIQVGFTDMMEVAFAADILSLKEALEFSEHVQSKEDLMITSCCCPIWVSMLRKVYNDLVKHVSPSVSPMVAMGRIIKKLNPEVKVVFIGPCLAKKAEAKEKDIADAVDYVLTFEEVKLIFEALEIKVEECKGVPAIEYASRGGRLYAHTSGVSTAVFDIVDELFPNKRELFEAVQADGVMDCKAMLKDIEEGRIQATFIEGMACEGGCVGGPKAIIPKEEGRKAVDEVAYDSAIKIPVHSQTLKELFKRLDIETIEDLKKNSGIFERKF